MLQSEAGFHYKNLIKMLKQHSSYPDPSIISHKLLCSEWIVIESYYDANQGTKCICEKEDICYINKIVNQYNGITLDPIGSSCVKRFEIEQLGTACMCCYKTLSNDNIFLQAYMKYDSITKKTLVIGHKKCATKLLKNAFLKGLYGIYLKKEFVSYFNNLGVSMKLDKSNNIDIEYSNNKLTTYIDALFD